MKPKYCRNTNCPQCGQRLRVELQDGWGSVIFARVCVNAACPLFMRSQFVPIEIVDYGVLSVDEYVPEKVSELQDDG